MALDIFNALVVAEGTCNNMITFGPFKLFHLSGSSAPEFHTIRFVFMCHLNGCPDNIKSVGMECGICSKRRTECVQ